MFSVCCDDVCPPVNKQFTYLLIYLLTCLLNTAVAFFIRSRRSAEVAELSLSLSHNARRRV